MLMHLSLDKNILSIQGSSVGSFGVALQSPVAGVVVAPTFEQTGNKVRVRIHVVNGSTVPVVWANFYIATFGFSSVPTGTMKSYDAGYIGQHAPGEVYYPSQYAPIGCTVLGDGSYYLSACAPSEVGQQHLVQVASQDNTISNPATIELRTTQTIQPGASDDFEALFSFAAARDSDELLSEWSDALPPVLHNTSPLGPIIAAQAVGPSWVNSSNPGGYDNPEVRNLRDPVISQKYAATMIALLQAVKGSGVIFWQPGGMDPTDYWPWCVREDDNLKLDPNWSAMEAKFNAAGLNAGILARFDNPQAVQRLAYPISTGIQLLYLDSAGADFPSIQRIIQARKQLGPVPRFFCEHQTDLVGRYADYYCEWVGDKTRDLTKQERADLAYINKHATWLCKDTTSTLKLLDYAPLGFVPLMPDGWAFNGIPK